MPSCSPRPGLFLDTTATPDQRQELFAAMGSLVAPGVKGQYLDEIVARVEYEVMDDLKLGIAFQDRRFGRVIEDVSLDNANTDVVSNPGEWSEEEERKLQARIAAEDNPQARMRLERQLEMFKGIRIVDRPRRDYDALQFSMTLRFSKRLYTQGSYTYSRTLGNYPGLINYNNQGTFAVDNTYASFVKQGTAMGAGTIQSANPVSGGTYDDLLWVKTIDRTGTESATPIGRNPNFGNTTARYSPMYARVGMRLTF